MMELNPKIIYVSKSEKKGHYNTISEAASFASEGDQIIVEEGTYADEEFPIYIPPRCQIVGAGIESSIIDGKKSKLRIASRPVDPYQSLVLLGDKSSISGFTICNSSANGLSNEQGADILISKNMLRDNDQHGALVFGANSALIETNSFYNNGTKKAPYFPPRVFDPDNPAKQGHHIFFESRPGSKNQLTVINNSLEITFADAIATSIYDLNDDGIETHVKIIGNIIQGCGRNGISICSSYGPSNSKLVAEIRNNSILDTEANAIDAYASLSLIHRTIHNSKLILNILQNEIKNCNRGIYLEGALCPAKNSTLDCNIIENTIQNAKTSKDGKNEAHGILVYGGDDFGSAPVEDNHCNLTVVENVIKNSGSKAVFVIGGFGDKKFVKNNSVSLHILENQIGKGKIVVKDGPPTNKVIVSEGSQKVTRLK